MPPPVPSPQTVLDRVRRDVERNALRARNGLKLVTGVDRPGVGQTPKDVVWQRGRTQLWHYRNESDTYGGVRHSPPLLIVFSLFSRSYILDLTPGNSFVEQLLTAGFDVYLLDWGEPDQRDAANTLEDYVDDYIPAGVDRVLELSGADEVNLVGYCFGGDLALLYAAHHPEAPLRSLTVMATPVDFEHMGPLVDLFRVGGLEVSSVLDADGNVPPRIVVQGFRSLTPTAEVTRYVTLWERLWNDQYVASYQAMTGWSDDHVPLPGAAAEEMVRMLVRDNGMVTDRLTVGGDRVHLSDVRVPFLTVRAERDHIVPAAASAPLIDLVGSPDKHELPLPAGHMGLVVGRTAARTTVPQIIDFLRRRSEPLETAR
ncbi:alpha/beta fold hydrolase [Geodermatophilus sabuli]|uniref:Polyhydroxyalkanoate synthase n=1 Tax=Geodermatophilus sabuli TaxID=1564158 RepID=A0A285EJW9_9ACTN|nr:alpha/beta fold hydrolase [Geodermatophilus sabuli]MBB3085961.1 polyhydroxyalkanoate synthase [Geodermatophilus sabuli]SNX98301.1 polyhydroxyalkanoate synthase [Geodermatophilus sabuli]